jgi:hypothetical protein
LDEHRVEEAIAALEKGLALRPSGNSEDFFFLAMAHQQAGHLDEARRWYQQGVAWMEQHAPQDATLQLYRAEAAGVLGVK